VRILPDKITINSFPGPDRSISNQNLTELKIISRRYRNRRIGEFLKELRLTEGKGTGFPTIIRSLKDNGSQLPIIHTDDERSFFQIEFEINQEFLKLPGEQSIYEIESIAQQIKELVLVMSVDTLSAKEIMNRLEATDLRTFMRKYIKPAQESGHLEMLYPEKPRNRYQKYKLTANGLRAYQALTHKQ
jgi:ATP-dependent DNA helicase RecG